MQVSFANNCFIINICIIPYMHFQHYSLRNKISFKISFQCSLKLFGQKVPWNFLQSSKELFEQHLNNICGSMEFHGILSRSKVPWNSMELFPHSRVPWNSMEFHGTFNFPQKSSMEFHGIPWNFFWSSMEFHGIPWNLINFIFKKIIFLNIVFGIWLMIRCYLAKISQKRYKLHWFQYRNSYFEHPSVSENGTRSAKMACCLLHLSTLIERWTRALSTHNVIAILIYKITIISIHYNNRIYKLKFKNIFSYRRPKYRRQLVIPRHDYRKTQLVVKPDTHTPMYIIIYDGGHFVQSRSVATCWI